MILRVFKLKKIERLNFYW